MPYAGGGGIRPRPTKEHESALDRNNFLMRLARVLLG
jgi:hypothetical protein